MMKVLETSTGNLLNAAATKYPEKEALVDISERKRLSYRQLVMRNINLEAPIWPKYFMKSGTGLGTLP